MIIIGTFSKYEKCVISGSSAVCFVLIATEPIINIQDIIQKFKYNSGYCSLSKLDNNLYKFLSSDGDKFVFLRCTAKLKNARKLFEIQLKTGKLTIFKFLQKSPIFWQEKHFFEEYYYNRRILRQILSNLAE